VNFLEKSAFRGNFMEDQSTYPCEKKLFVNKALYLLFHCKKCD